MGSIPRSGRSPGVEHGNPLQYSCCRIPTDRGAWQATVHRVAQSWTWLSDLALTHTHASIRQRKSTVASSPKNLREQHRTSPSASGGNQPCWQLDFRFPGLQIDERMNFLKHWCFKPHSLWSFVMVTLRNLVMHRIHANVKTQTTVPMSSWRKQKCAVFNKILDKGTKEWRWAHHQKGFLRSSSVILELPLWLNW